MVKRVGKYELGKTLGEGTFGKVKYAVNTETGERVAIKILDKHRIQKQNMGSQIKKEISIMKMVRHRHIVSLKEVLASKSKIFIVLELVTGGELFDKIVAEGRFNEETARFYFRQLVNGVRYCHGGGVCHRDLKPENLLLDEFGNLKISDFGLSALYTGDDVTETGDRTLLHTTCGTPNYVAPEVLEDKGYDGRTADVWSCGVILYVLLAGFLPFDEPTMSALFRKIQRAEFTYPSWFSAEVRGLLDKVLVADPRRRITLPELVREDWFTAGRPEEPPVGEMEPEAAPAPSPGGGGGGGGGGMASTPSADDMKRAVTEGVTVERDSKEDDSPTKLNAFEITNMCAGTALNRMLSTHKESRASRVGHFTSRFAPSEIMDSLRAALEADRRATVQRVDDRKFKLKASVETRVGTIGISAQVFILTPKLNLVEVRRAGGDILEFQKVYKALLPRLRELMQEDSGGGK